MEPQRLFRPRGNLLRKPVGEIAVDAAPLEYQCEFTPLRRRMGLELVAFLADLGVDKVVLGGHRDELAGGHRERAGRKAGQADQHQGMPRPAAATDASDQGDIRDQPVHRPEHGRTQPAARYVPVLVAVRLAARAVGYGHSNASGIR
jgi:hypothetical protein